MRNGLTELLDNFVRTLEAMLKQHKDEQAQNRDTSFAAFYYENTLNAYLSAIPILKKYSESTTKLLSLAGGTGEDAKQLSQFLNSIDSFRFIPKIFHPVYVEQNRRYFLRGDERCFRLAKKVEGFLVRLQTEDTNHTIFEIFKRNFGHKFAKIQHSLTNRIRRFEHNASYEDIFKFATDSELEFQKCQKPFKDQGEFEQQKAKHDELNQGIAQIKRLAPTLGEKISAIHALLEKSCEAEDKKSATESFEQVEPEISKLGEEIQGEIKISLARFKRFMENPQAYKNPEQPADITADTLHHSIDTAIRLAQETLKYQETECAIFLRDDPQVFVAARQAQDFYPSLLEQHFGNIAQVTIDAYIKEADAKQVMLFTKISEGADNIRRCVENHSKTLDSDEKLNSKIAELKVLVTELQARAKASSTNFKLLEDQVKGKKGDSSPTLLSLNETLFVHFKKLEKHVAKTTGLFKTSLLDDLSKEFYDEMAAIYQLIQGVKTMLGASIKCIALPLAKELKDKLLVLKEGFEKIKAHEKYEGYTIVCGVLKNWPNFAETEKNTEIISVQNNNNAK